MPVKMKVGDLVFDDTRGFCVLLSRGTYSGPCAGLIRRNGGEPCVVGFKHLPFKTLLTSHRYLLPTVTAEIIHALRSESR